MTEQRKKIDIKLKLLNYATKEIGTTIERKNPRELLDKVKIIERSLDNINEMKYIVIEEMLTEETEEEEVDNWTTSIKESIEPYEEMITDLKTVLRETTKRETAVKETVIVKDDSKRDTRTHAKLPKLQIAKFDGTHIDWFRFWNQFSAEIDSSSIAPVTKFSYMKDMLPTQALTLVNGLPFSPEGYERSKTILLTKYGKTSEVVNAHIQRIMGLPTVNGHSINRVHDFFEILVNSVQSLETMGKLSQIEGYVRMTLDKLPGIRSDLVRLDRHWQEWEFAQLVRALGDWTDRNPRDDRSHQPTQKSHTSGMRLGESMGRKTDKTFSTNAEIHACAYCDGNHKPTKCTKYTDINERRNILKTKRRCFNCTRGEHRASECKSRNCFNCNGRHHTSICDKQAPTKSNDIMCSTVEQAVTYPVILVKVNGVKCRALLDSGAGSNYISATLSRAIQRNKKKTELRRIEMLMSTTSTKVDVYEVDIQSLNSKFSLTCDASKVEKDVLLTIPNPSYRRLQESYGHLHGINFDDNDPKADYPIHLIIGVDIYCKIKMKREPRIGLPGQPVAELTRFGWVVMSPGEEIDKSSFLTQSAHDYDNLCRIDVLGLKDAADGDQDSVYAEFREQLQRDPEGWYETGLMWKANHEELPNNRAASLRRMNNLLSKLKREPGRLEEYNSKIAEQLKEGIVEKAPVEVQGREYYIPHKPVRRETAETTKLRIVYDASAKPNDSSPSLNDCLETGPLLINRLFNILIRNRMRPVAITGDIKQAFLQIRIRKEHRDALRFHWIEDTTTCATTILRFTRAVFGLVQSPFLLNGTVRYHFDHCNEAPREVVEAIKEDLYVDDVIGGGSTVAEAKALKAMVKRILGTAKFQLHKWHSNVKELEQDEYQVMEKLPATQEAATAAQHTTTSTESAILGVSWNKESDTISVKFPVPDVESTKRGILKYLASIYDPLGLVSPITLVGKMLYRQICDNKIGWDQQLPEDLLKVWQRWLSHLPRSLQVPRSIPAFTEVIQEITLHAFGDASKDGTSATVYAVVTQKSGVSQGIICSKSRLSKKSLTIPRLELVSAHMAANLLANVSQSLSRFPVVRKVAWSDSTTALHWIKGVGKYKEFVRNRVAKIIEKRDVHWRYVTTTKNPADIGSRGCHGDKLDKIWLEGPSWMGDELTWPVDITTKATTETEAESKKIKDLMAATVGGTDNLWNLLAKYCLWKVLRITSWVRRFVVNCKTKARTKGVLTTEEMDSSRFMWIKQIQGNHEMTDKFKRDKEMLNLQKNEIGVYVCMGRIEGDYPIYLPSNEVFSQKLIEHAHKKTLHGGVGFTMSEIRQRYWIPTLRQMTKGAIHRCNGCKRFHAIAFARPKMGNLPTDRTVGNRPFQVIGLDFAGPFTYLSGKKTERKTYILLYTCSLTRAVYLDVLKDQTFEGILMSLKSLIARRTRPDKIYSDNFSSFVTMSKWLKHVVSEERIHSFLANQQTKWQFNLSRAPWWGGQFERLVGLMKHTIWKAFGKTKPKFEELKSLMLDVETTINNRPLGYVEDDIQSTILTPNVMMFDYPVHIPHLDNIKEDLDVTVDLKKRYKYLKNAREKVWQRWKNEYLRYLRERHNLTHKEKEMELKEGDVVIIKGDEKNRAHWNLGIVDKFFPGKDGVVRAVRLRAGKTFLERSPEHLYPLELSCERKQQQQQQVKLDPKVREFRPRRTANAIARLLVRDQAEREGNEPLVE